MGKNGSAVAPAKVARPEKSRPYTSQQDVPGCSLESALRIPRAIGENYGYKPASPIQVAQAMEIQPTSGHFRRLTGAAIAYGLTSGGYNADTIGIEPLGMRIVRPTIEGDDVIAKREALLRPRVIREFLQKYDGAAIPKEDIGRNVLMGMGVPMERAREVLMLIIESAEAVGFLVTMKDKKHVDLSNTHVPARSPNERPEATEEAKLTEVATQNPAAPAVPANNAITAPTSLDGRAKRVFITHGKNRNFVEPIKGLLSYGELEPVVATESQTASLPVPLKVMGHMRSCGAAIIHVEGERKLLDPETNESVGLNENVLIEIGAAMALYGDRFILLVKNGVRLPSNLQGLYEVRYAGDNLDANDTVKLLGAIKDMKSRLLPG